MNETLLNELAVLHDAGRTVVDVRLANGERERLRLFRSQYGTLGYKGKGMRRRGYSVSGLDIAEIIGPAGGTGPESARDRYFDSLRKYQKAFTQECRPDLWDHLRRGYAALDIPEFARESAGAEDRSALYDALVKYKREHGGIDLITENYYKRQTVTGLNPPAYATPPQLSALLDRGEDFSFFWRDKYDVTVSAKKCEDGYKAWLSLEYKGCGNGHYYLLIDSNLAVFCEDD